MNRPWAAKDTQEFLHHSRGSGKGLEDEPGHLPQHPFLCPAMLGLLNLSLATHSLLKASHSAGNSALINLYVCNANHNMSEKMNLINLVWVLTQINHQTRAVQLYGVHGLSTVHFAPGKWTQCWDRTTEWKEISGSVTMTVWDEKTASLCLGKLLGETGRTLSSQARGIRLKIEILLSVLDTIVSPSWDVKNIYHCFLMVTKGLLSGPLPCHLY